MGMRFKRITSLFLSVFLLAACHMPSVSVKAESGMFTEIYVKKSEILQKGAFKAVQSALNAARYSATKDNNYKIIVEPGSYDLRSALHIYSNTTLSLYNVTLVRNKEALTNMIRTGDDTPVDKGDSGYGVASFPVPAGGSPKIAETKAIEMQSFISGNYNPFP